MDKTTRLIAEYACHQGHKTLEPEVVHELKRHMIDAVACALGALDSRPANVAQALARTVSSTLGASVLGLPEKTAPEYAAFANTVLIRFLDYNDTGNGGHPSDMIPAVLAVAEPSHSDGQAVLQAIHVEYETVAALRRGGLYGNALRKRHVDQVSTVLGGVAGASAILGLDLEQTANAIALAITPNIPLRVTRTGAISDWKGCATAHCAMMAVFAARLAEQGLTGPGEPFEGLAGFDELLGLEPLKLEAIGKPANGRSAVESTGLKPFPADYNAMGPLATILAMRNQFSLDDVEHIEVALHWGGWHAIGGGAGDHEEKWNPTTRETADHSLAYLLAVALMDGELTLESFTAERLRDPSLRPLMQKIAVVEDPEMTREHAGELPRWPSRVTVVLTNGKRIEGRSGPPKGHPLDPLSDGQVEDKFWDMSDRVQSRAAGRELLDTLWSLDRLSDISELTDRLRTCRN